METIDQILDMWAKDAEIDQTEPGKELVKIPKLHNKYLKMLMARRMASDKCKSDYLRMKKIRWEYYSGRMNDPEILSQYGWEPFGYTLKSDINTYLEADKYLIRELEQKMIHDEIIFALESIMSELKSRTYQLRDFISWEKFIGGQ